MKLKVGLICFAAMIVGCCPPARRVAVATKPIYILQPAADDAVSRANMKVLTEMFPAATRLRGEANISNALAQCRAEDALLLVPRISLLPLHLWQPLQDHLNRGGATVLLGRNPFEARARVVNARIETEDELFAKLARNARAEALPPLQSWNHENDSGTPRGSVRPVPDAPWPALMVDVDEFRDWDALVLTNVPTGLLRDGENSLVFFARGDTNTSRLALIAAERDGSHWYHVVSLTPSWQPYVLHESKFQHFYGASNRGREGDHLSLAKLKRMSLGLSMHLGAQSPGEHRFAVSDVRLAADPRTTDEISGWPDIMLVSPPYRHYEFSGPKLLPLQSPLARARGEGAPYRWTPLVTVADSNGVALGWPVSMFSDHKRRWVWIGADDPPREFITKAVAAAEGRVRPRSVPTIEHGAATTGDWLRVDGGLFAYRGKPVFLSGINYWPLSHNGKAPGEFDAHWLEPSVFDLEIISRDLDRLQQIGVNAVSIQYHEQTQAPQLNTFVAECRKRGIWVHCFVGGLQPLEQNLPKAQRLIEAADLKHQSGIFAIDVAWEPHLGGYGDRCRFDADWEAWLVEQYGSVEHAEKLIGRPLPIKDGVVTGPTDEELRTDGAHRVVVANYRRFVDDYMSRRYGEIERLVRRLGCKQLLGARSGYGGTGNHWADALLPVDVATGVVHFDFTSPEGYGLTGSLDQFYEGGFLTAYARGVSAGKPVVWVEFGCSVGQNPQRIDLDNQARIYRNMTELAERSHAAGMFGWWYPGGWRVDERSDFGIVNPDSTLRPAAIEYAKSRRDPSRPSDWNQREVDPAADARGLSALWDRWRATYREQMRRGEVQEVRLASFGKLTSELAPAAVGGRPYEAPAPLAYVNAEWGRVEVNGAELPRSPAKSVRLPANATVRVELINTGPATWDSAFVQDQPLAHTPFGQRVWISLAAPLSGVVRVRPELKGVGPFGEPLEIEITE